MPAAQISTETGASPDVPLAGVAKEASLPLRTAQRWVSRYRRFGLIGLIRAGRADQDKRRRVPDDLRRFAEGLALERPPLGPSAIYREICRIARARGEQTPGYYVLLVWKLDRLGRSLAHLIGTVTSLEQHGVGFRSITEVIDTTTPGGRLIFHLFGALGQFERDLIRERTRAGLTAATARGRMGGRKPVVDADKLERARGMIEKGLTVREAANRLKISKTALYEALRLCARNPVAWHNRDNGGRDGRQELAD